MGLLLKKKGLVGIIPHISLEEEKKKIRQAIRDKHAKKTGKKEGTGQTHS